MPIEHEYKYVLAKNDYVDSMLMHFGGHKRILITQHYLSTVEPVVRIREIVTHGGMIFNGDVEYIMTVKQRVDGRVVEIETHISKEDYELLMLKSVKTIRKARTSYYEVSRQLKIEIDCFLDTAKPGVYPWLYMVEVECHESFVQHPTLPTFLEQWVIHKPRQDEERFMNSNLDMSVIREFYEKAPLLRIQSSEVKEAPPSGPSQPHVLKAEAKRQKDLAAERAKLRAKADLKITEEPEIDYGELADEAAAIGERLMEGEAINGVEFFDDGPEGDETVFERLKAGNVEVQRCGCGLLTCDECNPF